MGGGYRWELFKRTQGRGKEMGEKATVVPGDYHFFKGEGKQQLQNRGVRGRKSKDAVGVGKGKERKVHFPFQ